MNVSKISCSLALSLGLAFSAPASASTAPTFDLEKKIAYQQGQFGGLYADCGAHDEQIVIGGSLANWRKETFADYGGTPQELGVLEKIFDRAAADVAENKDSCRDWQKQAASTWHGLIQLSEYGTPVASRP